MKMTLLRDLLGSDPGPSAAIDTTVGIALSKEYERANGDAAKPGTKDDAGRIRADSSLTRRSRRFLGKRALLVAAAVILVATGLVVARTHTSSTPGRITAWHAARSIASGDVSQNPPHSTGWQLVDDLVSTGWQQNTGGAASGLPRLPHYVCLFRAVRRLRISQGRLTAPLRVALRVFGPRRELVGSADAHRFRPVDTAVMPDGDELLRRRNDRREVHILVDRERRAPMDNSFIRASWVLVSPLLRWRNQLHRSRELQFDGVREHHSPLHLHRSHH